MTILKFCTALSVIALSTVGTLRLVDRPGAVLLAVLSGALGWLLAHLFNHGRWMRQERRISGDIGRVMDGIRISGKAPVALGGVEADADRYRRLDDSLAHYCAFLMGAEEGK